ncbi:MAG: hypothetical protein IJK01_08010 [Clostridia bacterium]|nr:hypothetical protein [Clostridia bacterium]
MKRKTGYCVDCGGWIGTDLGDGFLCASCKNRQAEGERLLNERRYAEAEALLESVVRDGPQRALPYALLIDAITKNWSADGILNANRMARAERLCEGMKAFTEEKDRLLYISTRTKLNLVSGIARPDR